MIQAVHAPGNPKTGDRSDLLLQAVLMLGQRMTVLEEHVEAIKDILASERTTKEWYTTNELADALGKSQYTIQERWCNEDRIACEKDPDTGKWRIPGAEFRRLLAGGALRPKRNRYRAIPERCNQVR